MLPTMPRLTSAAMMILVMIISPIETDETGLSRLNHDRRRCGPMERISSVCTFPVDFSFVFFCFSAPTRCGGARSGTSTTCPNSLISAARFVMAFLIQIIVLRVSAQSIRRRSAMRRR